MLAILAVASVSGEVRSNATQTLRLRDPRDAAPVLVGLLRDPVLDPDPILYHYYVQTVGATAIGSPGVLFVRGPHYDVLRYYTVDDSRMLLTVDVPTTAPSPGYPLAVWNQTRLQAINLHTAVAQILRESQNEVAAARLHVLQLSEFDARVVQVLGAVVGKDLGIDRESARKWWTEERGYAYEAPAPTSRQDWTSGEDKPTYIDSVHSSCFAADTPVFTLGGPRPIQSLKVGDQVLSQDTVTGTLSYQPIVAALHNEPAIVFNIKFGPNVIKATGIHRFWKAGSGWIMARDLKPGDRLRAFASVADVTAVGMGLVQPVFNLKVQNGQSYFAGEPGLLVHDSSLVEPVLEPFDAVPDVADRARAVRGQRGASAHPPVTSSRRAGGRPAQGQRRPLALKTGTADDRSGHATFYRRGPDADGIPPRPGAVTRAAAARRRTRSCRAHPHTGLHRHASLPAIGDPRRIGILVLAAPERGIIAVCHRPGRCGRGPSRALGCLPKT